jgi:hypothetical protein
MQTTDVDAERAIAEALQQLEQRRRTVLAKQDRAYEDFVEGRITQEFWRRKSEAWEADLNAVKQEMAHLQRPRPLVTVTAARIIELAKNAEILYKSQNPAERRRLLETVLSNCSFDCGSVFPTYTSPFDLLVRGNKTGNWRRGCPLTDIPATSRELQNINRYRR